MGVRIVVPVRRRWVLGVLVVVALASLGGYALARPSPASKISQTEPDGVGWTAYAPLSPASHASTQPRSYPIISLPPGKLILARLRLRSGAPYFIYGQRIRFQGGLYFCLSAGNPNGSFQTCPPWPLAHEPTRPLIGGGSPLVELAVAIAPRNETCTFIDIPGGPYRATRVPMPAALKIDGDVVYAFVKSPSGASETGEQIVIDSGKARCRPAPSSRHLRTGTAGAPVVVPSATNLNLDAAYARLHRAGLRVSYRRSFSAGSALDICWPTIERQSTRAGQKVSEGAVVELFAQPPQCSVGSPGVPVGRLPSAKVPNFVGQPISDAAAWAQRHDLYWQTDQLPPLEAGDVPRLLDNYRVTGQQPAAGRVLAFGIATGGGNEGSFEPTPLTVRGKLIQRR